MLSQFFKAIIVNNTGQTITYNNNGRLNLKVTRWFLTPSTGKIDYEQEVNDDFGFEAGGSLADGGVIEASEIDNAIAGKLFLGAQVQLEVTHDEGAAADGTVDIYLSSGDATGELQSDASGYDDPETDKLDLLGRPLTWHPTAVDDELIRGAVAHL